MRCSSGHIAPGGVLQKKLLKCKYCKELGHSALSAQAPGKGEETHRWRWRGRIPAAWHGICACHSELDLQFLGKVAQFEREAVTSDPQLLSSYQLAACAPATALRAQLQWEVPTRIPSHGRGSTATLWQASYQSSSLAEVLLRGKVFFLRCAARLDSQFSCQAF